MQDLLYHVVHAGRQVGPYDKRTIVGMKIKKALSSQQELVGSDGVRLTVAELVRQGQPEPAPAGGASGFALSGTGTGTGTRSGASRSVVQGIHAATLIEVEGPGYEIPPFKGELEVRVQTKVLRVSGRFREGLGWKEDRVKFPLQDIAHARLRGTIVDLWVRAADTGALQRISLDLLKPDAAGDLAGSLPYTAPWPGSEPLAAGMQGSEDRARLLRAAAVAATLLVVLVLALALGRR